MDWLGVSVLHCPCSVLRCLRRRLQQPIDQRLWETLQLRWFSSMLKGKNVLFERLVYISQLHSEDSYCKIVRQLISCPSLLYWQYIHSPLSQKSRREVKSRLAGPGTNHITLLFFLAFMEPQTAKKSLRLLWRCLQLLSGNLANGNLPRVSCQSLGC